MFTREFGYQISTYVTLSDPNGNEHEVMIEKRYFPVMIFHILSKLLSVDISVTFLDPNLYCNFFGLALVKYVLFLSLNLLMFSNTKAPFGLSLF